VVSDLHGNIFSDAQGIAKWSYHPAPNTYP
jgi:hypothetical protein